MSLAADIRKATVKLENGMLSEPDYVDDCLWIAFEAMIKLLAAYKTRGLCKEYSGFIQAVADISVQYGRYKLYKKELEVESREFDRLIDNAFSDDFSERLRNSVALARKAGVSGDKILDSTEKIDAFFLE